MVKSGYFLIISQAATTRTGGALHKVLWDLFAAGRACDGIPLFLVGDLHSYPLMGEHPAGGGQDLFGKLPLHGCRFERSAVVIPGSQSRVLVKLRPVHVDADTFSILFYRRGSESHGKFPDRKDPELVVPSRGMHDDLRWVREALVRFAGNKYLFFRSSAENLESAIDHEDPDQHAGGGICVEVYAFPE